MVQVEKTAQMSSWRKKSMKVFWVRTRVNDTCQGMVRDKDRGAEGKGYEESVQINSK